MWTIVQARWVAIVAVGLAALSLVWVVYDVALRFVGDTSSPGKNETAQTQAPAPTTEYKVQDIVSAHLFGKVQRQATKQVAAPRTRLRLKLLGMVASTDPKRAVALIAADNGHSSPYRIGEAIKPSGAVLRAIEPEKVIIERAGKMESLYLDRPTIDAPGDSHAGNVPSAAKRVRSASPDSGRNRRRPDSPVAPKKPPSPSAPAPSVPG